jgi:hypothetical protein
MSKTPIALAGAATAVAVVVASSAGDIRRYLKIRSM